MTNDEADKIEINSWPLNVKCNKCGQEKFIDWQQEEMCKECFYITMKKLGVGFFEPIS
jgi:Zn finger protein HypA/HybF involved in hydrogenase expression